jgi:hypothetical protein
MPIPIPSPWRGGGLNWLVQRFPSQVTAHGVLQPMPIPRMRWLVDTYLKLFYARFQRLAASNAAVEGSFLPHAFYALAGGASMILAIRPECRRLTGLDAADGQVIERHAASTLAMERGGCCYSSVVIG